MDVNGSIPPWMVRAEVALRFGDFVEDSPSIRSCGPAGAHLWHRRWAPYGTVLKTVTLRFAEGDRPRFVQRSHTLRPKEHNRRRRSTLRFGAFGDLAVKRSDPLRTIAKKRSSFELFSEVLREQKKLLGSLCKIIRYYKISSIKVIFLQELKLGY
jgi:hypothetical protein